MFGRGIGPVTPQRSSLAFGQQQEQYRMTTRSAFKAQQQQSSFAQAAAEIAEDDVEEDME